MRRLKENIKFLLHNQNEIQEENNEFPAWNKGYSEALKDVLFLAELAEDTEQHVAIRILLNRGEK